MSTAGFDEAQVRRGQPTNKGQFAENAKSHPGTDVIGGADQATNTICDVCGLRISVAGSTSFSTMTLGVRGCGAGKHTMRPVDAVDETEETIAEIIRRTGAPDDEARQAVVETDNLEAAVSWAWKAAAVRSLKHGTEARQKQVAALEQVICDDSVTAAVTRILMAHPNANQIELCDPDGRGYPDATVFVDGADVELSVELENDLYDATVNIDTRQPSRLAKWCIGYSGPDNPYKTLGLETDRNSDELNRAVINLDLFRPAKD